ncbi:MAG: hypothetical protein ACI4WW_02620 [Candidatus Coprovivens sp.]
MAKSNKVAYIFSNQGNEKIDSEILYVNGTQTTIQANKQVMVDPYISDILNECKLNERKNAQPNEQMENHDYF